MFAICFGFRCIPVCSRLGLSGADSADCYTNSSGAGQPLKRKLDLKALLDIVGLRFTPSCLASEDSNRNFGHPARCRLEMLRRVASVKAHSFPGTPPFTAMCSMLTASSDQLSCETKAVRRQLHRLAPNPKTFPRQQKWADGQLALHSSWLPCPIPKQDESGAQPSLLQCKGQDFPIAWTVTQQKA